MQDLKLPPSSVFFPPLTLTLHAAALVHIHLIVLFNRLILSLPLPAANCIKGRSMRVSGASRFHHMY